MKIQIFLITNGFPRKIGIKFLIKKAFDISLAKISFLKDSL